MHYASDYFHILQHISVRYFLVAGIAFLLCYVLFVKKAAYKKIQARFPRSKDYVREIGFSIFTMCLFALVPLLLIKNPSMVVHTTLYRQISDQGWFYFVLAFPLMFVMHDTYFYWTHRLMHHKKLFPLFHRVHHRSTNPSPWAAYAFHPLEAIVEIGIYVVFLFTIPMHFLHFYIFFFLSIVYNVYGHLGYELYPAWFSTHWLGRWINTSVNHNRHHQYFKGNYGLYFTCWDRLMHTLRTDSSQSLKKKCIVQEEGASVATRHSAFP